LLHTGIYGDNFVFFSEDPAEEELFRKTLASKIKVDFMGDVDYTSYHRYRIHVETLGQWPLVSSHGSKCVCDGIFGVESQLLCRTHLFTVGSLPVSFTANRDISVQDWSFLLQFPLPFCAALNSVIN
jgi:hypothetical protein